MEEGREHEYSDKMDCAFTYADDMHKLLVAHGVAKNGGLTLDTTDAEADFAILMTTIRHVLSPISHFEFSMLLDLEREYEAYHVVLNEILFTALPVVLRGRALALYHESREQHPGDGRCALQRLRFAVEGVPDPDTERFWTKMRSTIINDKNDPGPQLDVIKDLMDKHARTHSDYHDSHRVRDLRYVLSTSAKKSCFTTPLYLVVLRDLRKGLPFSFASLTLLVRTVHREEAPLATLTTPAAPSGSGGGGSAGSAHAFRKVDRKVEPVGEWKAESGDLYTKWVGTGLPCITCHRMWNVTTGHLKTNTMCPYICKEAYAPTKAPALARPAPPAPPTPPPPTAAAVVAPPAAMSLRALSFSTATSTPADSSGGGVSGDVPDVETDLAAGGSASGGVAFTDRPPDPGSDEEDYPAFRRAPDRMPWPISSKKK